MYRSSETVSTGLSDLRAALSSPGDYLYQHLTDLMVALEETGTAPASNAAENKHTDEGTQKSLIASASNVDYGQKNGSSGAVAALAMSAMDTSGPSRRKLRRRRQKKNGNVIIPETLLPPTKLAIGNRSAVELCISHSPLTGESSFDDQQKVVMGLSDSEVERCNYRRTAFKSAVTENGNYVQKLLIKQQVAYTDNALATFITPAAPIESDSFTDTLTPARRSHRRKRLVKRMAVDQPSGQLMLYYGPHLGANFSMDVDLSPGCRRSTALAYLHNSSSSGFGENSIHSNHRNSFSSSGSEDDKNSSDGGCQGDDELSDWCVEKCNCNGGEIGDECMGIPAVQQPLRFNTSKVALTMESSDTDISQSSCSQPSRRLLSKSGASMCSALNRRIVQFLRDPTEIELPLGELRKKERKEAFRLAMFYHLDIRREMVPGCRYHVLVKTKFSRLID